MTRRDVERRLRALGFLEVSGGKSSHRHFVLAGVKITLPGHGRQDLSRKHVGMIERRLRTTLGLNLQEDR